MKSFKDIYDNGPSSEGGDIKRPTSKRAYLIQRICEDLFTDDDFVKIFGQTSEMTEGEIQSIFDEAKGWKVNPQALFWKLIKGKRESIKSEKTSK